MATLVSAVNTTFTPAVGTFNIQCTGGDARLDRRNTAGSAWAIVGNVLNGQSFVVDNPVGNAQYQFVTLSGSPTVQAEQ